MSQVFFYQRIIVYRGTKGKAGLSKAIRDRLQNHALTDVSSVHYDRYDYLKEKREAMNAWDSYLELLIHPKKNVVHINKRKKEV